MGSLTDFAENAILNHIFGNIAYTPATDIYVAFGSTTAIDDGTGFTEATYGSYARKIVLFGAADSRSIVQSTKINFAKSTLGNETYSYYALFDAVTGGNILAYGDLNNDINVVTNSTPSIAASEIVINVTPGSGTGMATYLADKTLDLMFNGTAYSSPSIYVGLTTTTISDASTGTSISDPTTNNYTRILYSNWSTATTGTLNNTANIQFSVPSGTWGTVVASSLTDAATVGNLLFYDNDNLVDQTIGFNDDVKFLATNFDVSID